MENKRCPGKKHIVLCSHPGKDAGLGFTVRAKDLLSEAGYDVSISFVYPCTSRDELAESISTVPLECELEDASLLVVFGGDGTILEVARSAMGKPITILGVNLGHKGFMAELEPDETELLLKVAAGNYTCVNRMMIDVELIRDGQVIVSDCALNDAVICATATTLRIAAYGDGSKITEYTGDGIIIATPTGSTAYSLSAGGSLVEPSASNILLTPICAHLTTARPFILAPDRHVTIKAPDNYGKQIWLSVDGGQPIAFYPNDELKIKKSEHCTIMAHISDKSFYDRAFEKLGGKR